MKRPVHASDGHAVRRAQPETRLNASPRRNPGCTRAAGVAITNGDPLGDPRPLIGRVYAYVASRIGDGPEAEDVTSEVFERALRYRASYDPAKGEPLAWLLGIARRRIEASRSVPLAELDEAAQVVWPDDVAEAVSRRLSVAAAVAELDERAQHLIALRYGADLSAGQIADHLGARTNAIEVALHRALRRLRTTIGR